MNPPLTGVDMGPINETLFVCGVDLAKDKTGKLYVCDYSGAYPTELEAVRKCATLHPSLGYEIYLVRATTVNGLRRLYGLRAGAPCSGHLVVERRPRAFLHPAYQPAYDAFAAALNQTQPAP